MSQPPLANLFAFSSSDAGVLRSVSAGLRKSGEFEEVWKPAPGWIVGVARLPGAGVAGESLRRPGVVFAEGRDAALEARSGRGDETLTEFRATALEKPAGLSGWPGDFGFIAFGEDGGATVARSCGGLAPFYVTRGPGWSCVSTRLKWLIRFAPRDFAYDPLINALWAAGWTWFPERRTFFEDVAILERGSWARVVEGSTQFGRYWTPRPDRVMSPDAGRSQEHARRLRELLIDRLERDLNPDGGNLLTLSGGVDSSALGAMAAGLGRKVSSFTLLPVAEESYTREMSFIRPLARECGFERAWERRLPRLDYLSLLNEAPDVQFQVSHPALCALPDLMRRTRVTTLFGGEMADILCGSVANMPDLIDTVSLGDALERLTGRLMGPRFLGAWFKHRWRGLLGRLPSAMPFPESLPDLMHKDVRAEYLELLDRRRRKALRDRAAWRQLGMLLEVDGWTAMNWEATAELGVRRSIPFNCREIIELTLECHPLELVGEDNKLLLRRALKDDVPARNLFRRDKGGWGRNDPTPGIVPWSDDLSDRLQGIVREDWFPRPPEGLDYDAAKMLTRLAVFDRKSRSL